jgi:hypothetical protein
MIIHEHELPDRDKTHPDSHGRLINGRIAVPLGPIYLATFLRPRPFSFPQHLS